MRKSFIFLSLTVSVLLFSKNILALNLDWSGVYRVESVQIKNSELDKVERRKSYINHHLVLKPRATVADGLNVFSRFDVFNNSGMSNSQFGQFFGSGIGNTTRNSSDNSNVISGNQADETLLVTQLYLTYDFEFMKLLVGRAPLEFGLGMTHSAGDGMFDHWYDNRDMISGEFVMGNLKMTPMFGKVSEGELDIGDDVRDYIFRLDYNNPETETDFGLMWQVRKAGIAGNDFPITTVDSGGGTIKQGFSGENINFFLRRGWESFSIGFEGGFAKGNSGVTNSLGQEINQDGFGFVLELDYKPEQSNWHWDLKTGYATGDDPSTTDKVEGFYFDRNYNVGILLFNHVLGQFDALNTSIARNTALDLSSTNGFTNAGSVPDMETVSNAIFISPGFNKRENDRWSWGGRLVYATLTEDTARVAGVARKIDTDLGFEIDLNVQFKPHERFVWITEAAAFLPGKAFEGAGVFDSEFAYGLFTKAAINF